MPARHIVFAGALSLAPLAPMAQCLPPPDAAGAAILPHSVAAPQLLITTTRSLHFGRFVAGSGGSLTVSPGGARARSGGVVLMNSGGSASAGFEVGTLDGGASAAMSVILSLPADGEVFLSNGASSMAVRDFVSSAGTLISLAPTGVTVDVGATLMVGAGQAPGAYSGTFQLIVNYQ